MSTTTYLRRQVDPGWRSLGLAVGDAVAITAFATVGAAHHGESPLDPVAVGWIVAPFLVGWAVAAVIGGLYTGDATASPVRALSWSLPAWIVASLLGSGLRGTALFPGDVALTFVAVTIAVGGAFVVGWRVLAAALVGRV